MLAKFLEAHVSSKMTFWRGILFLLHLSSVASSLFYLSFVASFSFHSYWGRAKKRPVFGHVQSKCQKAKDRALHPILHEWKEKMYLMPNCLHKKQHNRCSETVHFDWNQNVHMEPGNIQQMAHMISFQLLWFWNCTRNKFFAVCLVHVENMTGDIAAFT